MKTTFALKGTSQDLIFVVCWSQEKLIPKLFTCLLNSVMMLSREVMRMHTYNMTTLSNL